MHTAITTKEGNFIFATQPYITATYIVIYETDKDFANWTRIGQDAVALQEAKYHARLRKKVVKAGDMVDITHSSTL